MNKLQHRAGWSADLKQSVQKKEVAMRLSEDQIKQGILHPDKDVRFACLRYFGDCLRPNVTVMPVVIEALERFGRTSAFPYIHPISHLAQTEATIRWAIDELCNQPRQTEKEQVYLDNLCRLLCHADTRLLAPQEQAILKSPGFSHEYIKPLTHRLKLLSWNGDALWRELEIICEEGKDKTYSKDVRFTEAKAIVEALGREGDRHADRMMSLLGMKIENFQNNPMSWMEPLMVRLAGELRYLPAIPLLVSKLHEDGEVLSEECLTALVKIGTDDVIEAVRHDYPTAKWHFRLYASGILGRIHTDVAVATGIELLANEEDLDLENWLAQALVEHFSYEGNEAARKVLLSDPDLFDLQQALVHACTLMEQQFPELDQWRQEMEEKLQPKRRPSDVTPRAKIQPSAPVLSRPVSVKAETKAGRNDPCPCGSGKKYKKCCLTKKSVY